MRQTCLSNMQKHFSFLALPSVPCFNWLLFYIGCCKFVFSITTQNEKDWKYIQLPRLVVTRRIVKWNQLRDSVSVIMVQLLPSVFPVEVTFLLWFLFCNWADRVWFTQSAGLMSAWCRREVLALVHLWYVLGLQQWERIILGSWGSYWSWGLITRSFYSIMWN